MSAIAASHQRRLTPKSLMAALAHAYIWIWLLVFAMPFITTLMYSLEKEGGSGYSLAAYDYVFGTFKDNLWLSFKTTIITIIINLLISIPAAYAIVRFRVPGK